MSCLQSHPVKPPSSCWKSARRGRPWRVEEWLPKGKKTGSNILKTGNCFMQSLLLLLYSNWINHTHHFSYQLFPHRACTDLLPSNGADIRVEGTVGGLGTCFVSASITPPLWIFFSPVSFSFFTFSPWSLSMINDFLRRIILTRYFIIIFLSHFMYRPFWHHIFPSSSFISRHSTSTSRLSLMFDISCLTLWTYLGQPSHLTSSSLSNYLNPNQTLSSPPPLSSTL